MAEKTKLARSLALGIFHFCGWSTAGKWDSAKMATKLQDVPSVAPDKDPEDAKVKEAFELVKTTVAAGGAFEIEEDIAPEEKAATTKTEKAAKAPKEKKEKVVKEKPVKEARVTWLSAAAEVFKAAGCPTGEIADELVKKVNDVKCAENDSLAKNHLKVVQEVFVLLQGADAPAA